METGNKKNLLQDCQDSSPLSKKLELSSRDGSPIAENKSIEEMTSQTEMKSSSDESAHQRHVDDEIAVEEISMNDLPPEILTQILNCVDTSSLFGCRLVNRLWLKISTGILCTRPEVELEFDYYSVDNEMQMLVKRKGTLGNFIKCMNESKNCPFVRFCLKVPTSFIKELFILFSSFDFTRIKCLKLSIEEDFKEDDDNFPNSFYEELGDLLLNKMTQLEEFGLEMPRYVTYSVNEPQFNWPSNSSSSSSTSNSNSDSNSVQLPHLKVIRFPTDDVGIRMFSSYRKIIHVLLTAAINLKEIKDFSNDDLLHLNLEEIHYLESIDKLDCVKEVEIDPSPHFISEIPNRQPQPLIFPALKLCKLELCDPIDLLCHPDFWPDFTNFLSALFESSKDTLESLSMPQYGFLHNLQFPTFTKLEILILEQHYDDYFDKYEKHDLYDYIDNHQLYQFFPPGAKCVDVFPAVQFLIYNIHHLKDPYPEESFIPHLPSVERVLLIIHTDFKGLDSKIEHLGLICPSIKDFVIHPPFGKSSYLDFCKVVRAICTHMPKLESLELLIDLDVEKHNSHALDSCFTGFSETTCKRLFEMAENDDEKTLKKGDSPAKILESQPRGSVDLMPEREFPSIFDMKDLKKLTVKVKSGGNFVDRKEFIQKLTWVSEEYALKLMPRLKLTEGKSNWW